MMACSRCSVVILVLFVFLCLFTTSFSLDFVEHYQDEVPKEDRLEKHKYYFAYGADMLFSEMSRVSRDPRQPPVFVSPAVLKGYRLDFDTRQRTLDGATATICKAPHYSVWGVVWGLKVDDLRVLKILKNRGSLMVWYLPVYSPEGKEMLVMTFISKQPLKKLTPWIPLPINKRPSLTYLMAMVNGAIEARLPNKYVLELYKIPHNDRFGREHPESKLPEAKDKAVGVPDPYNIELSIQINNNS